MQRWKQYGSLLALFAAAIVAGLWGFSVTGGAVPWAKRSAQTLQRGIQEGSGSLVDFGRGVIVAGPIRNAGLVFEYVLLVAALVVTGVGLYLYTDRYHVMEEERA
jgi:hypothetical protein